MLERVNGAARALGGSRRGERLFWIGSRDFLIYAFGAAWALAGFVGLLGGLGLWRQRLLRTFLLATAVVAVAACILFVAAPGPFLEGF